MSTPDKYYLDQLTSLNNLVQGWCEDNNKDKFIELLLEFDLIVNTLKEHAVSHQDKQLIDLFDHYERNLVLMYESSITEQHQELVCAWPIYMSEFIANRNNEEAFSDLKEFLQESNWLAVYEVPQVELHESESLLQFEGTDIEEMNSDIDFDNDIGLLSSSVNETEFEDEVNNVEKMSSEQQELLDLINAEIAEIQEFHTERLNQIITDSNDNPSRLQDEIDLQADQLDRIASASDMVGLQGLKKFCHQLKAILQEIRETEIIKLVELKEELQLWPDIIQAYLFSPQESEYILAALDYLSLDCWPIQLTSVEQKYFEDAFYQSKVETDTGQTPERIRQAAPENISLKKPDDIPDELFDSLLQDLPKQTADFSLAVQQLRNDDFIEQLEVSKRIAHTLKGAGNTVGIQGLATLTHHLEDILEALLKERVKPITDLHNVIENAADCLEEMSEFLHGMGDEPSDILDVLQEILNWANSIDENGIPTKKDSGTSDETIVELPQDAFDTQVTLDTQEIVAMGEGGMEKQSEIQIEQSLRVSTGLVNDLLKRAGENIISNGQIQEYIQRSKSFAKQLRMNNNKIRNLVNELEHLIEVRGISSRYSEKNKDDKFDPLEMDQFNELNTYANLLIEAAADSNEFALDIEESLLKLDNLSSSQRRILAENQDAVLRIRMVPIKSIVQRLKRSVKQANKISQKSTKLEITGDHIHIDSDILNQLVDPLMHILRNAVDHGIESAQTRKAMGKPENGLIKLNFRKQDKLIHISCEDDGRGLDIDRIKSKALSSGMLKEDQAFEKEDALKLILQHGFSTKEKVSQLSGRGVGLDVVYEQVRTLKGSVSLDTKEGHGAKIELGIPMTLHTTQALLTSCGGSTLAISSRGIEEILHPGAGKLNVIDGKNHFVYKQKDYPIFDLQALLFNEKADVIQEPHQAVLIIKDEFDQHHALMLDKILDSREFVVKPFSRYIPKMTGLLGSTIIGDGSVVSVLDLLDIINIKDANLVRKSTPKHQEASKLGAQVALIIEDAISTRKSLEQFMKDLGFTVLTAKDGVEAIDKIQQLQPSIIITDLEMPRMNGLELTSHLRANEATKDTPIVMITSRATEKHKKEAKRIGVTEYMTKPYDEDLLLNIVNKYSISA